MANPETEAPEGAGGAETGESAQEKFDRLQKETKQKQDEVRQAKKAADEEKKQQAGERKREAVEAKKQEKNEDSDKDKKKSDKKDSKNGDGDKNGGPAGPDGPNGTGYPPGEDNPGDNVDYVEPLPGERREKVPFLRTVMNYFNGARNAPKAETDFLDREKNYSKPEEIKSLCEAVQNHDFELLMRNKRFKEIYGGGYLGYLKAWLTGDGIWRATNQDGQRRLELVGSDFCYNHAPSTRNHEVGRLEYRWWNETARKVTNVTLKTLRFAIPGVILGALTGGMGAAFLPALGGTFIGRGAVEGLRSAASGERQDKEKIEITRIRYFQKARELAQRVGPEYAQANTNLPEEDYTARRAERVKDLLNFIYSYEELSTEIEFDERGRPIIDTDTRITPGQARDGVPGGAHDVEYNAYLKGTEVTQPSRVSPDTVKIKDLETRLEKQRKRWDRFSEYGAMLGGIAGAAWYTLKGGWGDMTKGAYDQMNDSLNRGEIVNLDMDGNLKWHGVQKAGELSGVLNDQFMFHYSSFGEALAAQANGAQGVVEGVGKFGVHALGEQSMLQMSQAIYKQAILQVSGQLAKIAAAIGISTGIGLLTERANAAAMTRYRDEIKRNYEQRRIRNLPDEAEDLRAYIERERLIPPYIGQFWIRQIDQNTFQRVQIVNIAENGDIFLRIDDPNFQYNPVYRISMRNLLRDYQPVMTQAEAQRAAQGGAPGAPGTPWAPPAPAAPGTPPVPGAPEAEPTQGDIERENRTLVNLEMAAEHRTRQEKESKETFLLDEKEVRPNQQMMILIHNTDQNPLHRDRLKEISRLLRSGYANLPSSEVASNRMENSLRQLSDRIKNEISYKNTNWSIVVTADNGDYFAYRTEKNEDQLFHVSGSGEINFRFPDRSQTADVGKKGKKRQDQYFAGNLNENERIALLDQALSRNSGQDADGRIIVLTEERNKILRNNQSAREQIEALNKLGIDNIPTSDEFNGIVAKYQKTAASSPAPAAAPGATVDTTPPTGPDATAPVAATVPPGDGGGAAPEPITVPAGVSDERDIVTEAKKTPEAPAKSVGEAILTPETGKEEKIKLIPGQILVESYQLPDGAIAKAAWEFIRTKENKFVLKPVMIDIASKKAVYSPKDNKVFNSLDQLQDFLDHGHFALAYPNKAEFEKAVSKE